MARPRLPLLPRRPEVPWPAIIEALRVAGISTRRVGAALALSHSTIDGWKRGAMPNFEDGQAFLALAWRERELLPAELVTHCEPRHVDMPACFRGEPVSAPRHTADRRPRQASTPRAEAPLPVAGPAEPSPWAALDAVSQLWRGLCAEAA